MNDVVVTRITSLVDEVAALPWVWPGEPTAEAAEVAGAGTCASKHALLRRELGALGVLSRPMFVAGARVPSILAEDPNLADATDLIEVHELLVVSVPGVGPCRVDVTWDQPLIRAGLPGQLGW